MSILILGALLCSQPVEVRSSSDLPPEVTTAIVEELVRAIGRVAPACEVVPACDSAIPRCRVLVLELFEAVTVYRIRATLGTITARADLPLDRAVWAPPLSKVAADLFPAPTVVAYSGDADWALRHEPETSWRFAQYGGMGTGGLALVVGVGLAIAAQSRLGDLDSRLSDRNAAGFISGVSYDEAVAEHVSATSQGNAGLAVAIVGGAVVAGAVAWFLADPSDL